MVLWHEIIEDANEPVGKVKYQAKDATNNPLLSGLVGVSRKTEGGEDVGKSTLLPIDSSWTTVKQSRLFLSSA